MTQLSRLTTHVLDLSRGCPAAGMGVVLSRLTGTNSETVVAVTTNDDGRTDEPLLAGPDFAPGRYQLTFSVGDYFAKVDRGDTTMIPYLDIVPIQFGVAADVGHLHVALLVTPWSYTTYRGS